MSGCEIDTINLNTWAGVEAYIDSESSFVAMPPSYFERAIYGGYPRDAFSKGQLASKSWLLEKLFRNMVYTHEYTVALLGCWVGSIVQPLFNIADVKRVYGIDVCPDAINLAERFNQRYVQDGWKFKGVVADASTLCTSNMLFETSGELIQVTPDIVINTSCEHITQDQYNLWLSGHPQNSLLVLQSNNYNIPEHVRTASTLEEFKSQCGIDVIWSGELVLPLYTRYMIIGKQ